MFSLYLKHISVCKMSIKLKLLALFIFAVLCVDAQQVIDSTAVSLPLKNESRLQADTTTQPFDFGLNILLGKDPLKKLQLLSTLNFSLKSISQENEYWKLDSIVYSNLNEDLSEIVPNSRTLFKTQEENRVFQVKNYSMDEEEGHWIIDELQNFWLNDNGQLDSIEYQKHVTLNYILYTRVNYSYDDGFLHTETRQEKFDEFDDWEKKSRNVYEYDSLGLLSAVYSLEPDLFDGTWSTYEYVSYKYDVSQNLIRETYYDYDDYEMIATKTSELQYTYDDQNLLESVIEYVEGWQEGTFVENTMQQNSYDENGNLVSETYYEWDYDIDNWTENVRKSFYFDDSPEILHSLVIEKWENTWLLDSKSDYHTENMVPKSNIESAVFLFSFLPMFELNGLTCESILSYEWNGSDWEQKESTTYHFSQTVPVGVETVDQLVVQVFPNPTSDYLWVEIGIADHFTCIIRDLNGRSLINESIANASPVDMRSLSQGIYLVEIQQNGSRIFTEKIIKK